MKKNIIFLGLLFLLVLIIALTNQQIRLYIFAQQQQGVLQFNRQTSTISPLHSPQASQTFTEDSSGIQQVDWVFDNMGRCWNAWSVGSCTMQAHEGGVTVPSMRDLNNDGIEDITCSQGGTINGTTITNTSDSSITINCERYSCDSCVSGNGIHAQCDGGTDPTAHRVAETVVLTPGCVATCTMTGAYGTCLEKKEPPANTPVPTTAQATSTVIPSTNPTVTSSQPSPSQPVSTAVPSSTTVPTQPGATNTTMPTQIATPTIRPVDSQLPVAIDYSSYTESYNQYPPTYMYAMLNRTYNAQNTERAIRGLAGNNGNVVKMLMISEYNALEQILTNHADEIRSAGITWVGYNAERDGRTPEAELTAIFSADPSTNMINKMGRLTDQYGLKLMLGPVTPMWNEYFRRSDRDAVAQAMIGNNCYLDGVAFQEQKQISRTNKAERASIVGERTAFFRNHANNCPQFEAMVQIMSSWCTQNATWEECKGYYNLLKNLQGPSRINSLAIWASGAERNDLPEFIQFLRN